MPKRKKSLVSLVAVEISKKIGASGKKIAVDGGGIWIKRGQPFAQNMGDESDDLIKRKYINISIVFITQD